MTPTEIEREKYRRIWTEVPRYRHHSPGEALVDTFLKNARPFPRETLIDIGCGPGRASAKLAEFGLHVTQMDITATALDPEVRALKLPFLEASLWEMPLLFKFDWVYCTDVLEHLPTDKVDAALDALAKITVKGAFLQIALFPDGMGYDIGEKLHLTVKPTVWWQEKIERRWFTMKYAVDNGRLVTLTGAAKP